MLRLNVLYRPSRVDGLQLSNLVDMLKVVVPASYEYYVADDPSVLDDEPHPRPKRQIWLPVDVTVHAGSEPDRDVVLVLTMDLETLKRLTNEIRPVSLKHRSKKLLLGLNSHLSWLESLDVELRISVLQASLVSSCGVIA